MIKFTEGNHSYESLDHAKKVDWMSVTALVSLFKPHFDAVSKSQKASKNPKSKWFGIDPEKIQAIWKGESKRSTDAGRYYHHKREDDLLASPPIIKDGIPMIVSKPYYERGVKFAPPQKLFNNTVYPEFLAYSATDEICGQSDKVEVFNNRVSILDYKTIKTFKTEGYTNWEGVTTMMQQPIDHLEDCHLVHYSLQLSLYMYMILRHNPQFLPGDLSIEHIIFELDKEDEHGFPIYKKDKTGANIVKETKTYPVTYLKQEVYAMLEHYKNNKETMYARKNI